MRRSMIDAVEPADMLRLLIEFPVSGAQLVSPLVGSDNLAFRDGYLFRVMVDTSRLESSESSLSDYCKTCVEVMGSALSEYDRVLFEIVSDQ